MVISNYAVECAGARYGAYRVYAALMVACYPVGIPLTYLCLLYANRDRIAPPGLAAAAARRRREKDEAVAHVQFLWRMYEPRMMYWEVVECARRLALTAVLSLVAEPGSLGQLAISFFVALAAMTLVQLFQPYVDPFDNAVASVLWP